MLRSFDSVVVRHGRPATGPSRSGYIDVALEDESAASLPMIDYGVAPSPDEIEVTLFGPGYGEAIAVHLGEGTWLLVDSCIDPVSRAPASGTYLEQIGVSVNQVLAIVASHWHDDHVRRPNSSPLATQTQISSYLRYSTIGKLQHS